MVLSICQFIVKDTPPKANDLKHWPIHINLDVIEAVNSSFASLVLRWPFSLDEVGLARLALLATFALWRVGRRAARVDLVGFLDFTYSKI